MNAKKIADVKGWDHIDVDDWRGEMWQDPAIRPWVDYFIDKDEADIGRLLRRRKISKIS